MQRRQGHAGLSNHCPDKRLVTSLQFLRASELNLTESDSAGASGVAECDQPAARAPAKTAKKELMRLSQLGFCHQLSAKFFSSRPALAERTQPAT